MASCASNKVINPRLPRPHFRRNIADKLSGTAIKKLSRALLNFQTGVIPLVQSVTVVLLFTSIVYSTFTLGDVLYLECKNI